MKVKTTKYTDLELDRPVAVIGFPTAGLVSSIAANFYITQLEMTPVAGMSSADMPPYCLIGNGMALPPVRFFGRKGTGKTGRDVVVCMSEYTPKPECCYDLAHAILDYLRGLGCEEVICLEGVPRFTDEDEMVAFGSGPRARSLLRKTKLKVMDNGMVRGITGILLYDGPSAGMTVLSLMCPANQAVPDPGSAILFMSPVNKIIPGFRVDTKPLLAEADEIQRRIDEQEALDRGSEAQYYG